MRQTSYETWRCFKPMIVRIIQTLPYEGHPSLEYRGRSQIDKTDDKCIVGLAGRDFFVASNFRPQGTQEKEMGTKEPFSFQKQTNKKAVLAYFSQPLVKDILSFPKLLEVTDLFSFKTLTTLRLMVI